MKHFKSPSGAPGFSFVEVVLVVAIIGVVATALFNLQGVLLPRISFQHQGVVRLYEMQNVFIRAEQRRLIGGALPHDKKQHEDMTLWYGAKKPETASALARFKHIIIEQVHADWQDRDALRKEMLMRVMVKPERKKV